MKKKSIIYFVSVVVLCIYQIASVQAFSDVGLGDWYYGYVQNLLSMGVVDGSKDTFNPSSYLTRDMAAKIIVKAAGYTDKDLVVPTVPSFVDVPKSLWSYSYVETAKSLGFVSGYGNKLYGPGNEVSRAEFAAMIVRAFKLEKNVNSFNFNDVRPTDWFYDVVGTVFHWSIVDGYGDGSFKPYRPINRAEMSKMIVRAMTFPVPVSANSTKNTGLTIDNKVVDKPKVTNGGGGTSGTSSTTNGTSTGGTTTTTLDTTGTTGNTGNSGTSTTSANTFVEDFSSFSPQYYDDGKYFGSWLVKFAGYGLVGIESDGANKWLRLSPKAVTSADATESSLVAGPKYNGPIQFEAKLLTIQQLRTGSTPNPWEVGWMAWNYTDNEHFYYFIPKPNGWELGKRDPNYPGGQRFLATGTDVLFPIGQTYDVKIEQYVSNAITVWVNGTKITTFTDLETPYSSGNIVFYTEDALIRVDDVSVKY